MKIITCASYYGTGSSAIIDYFGEFSSCFSFADYEFRFVHDPDGISDLEYNLVQNHNRNNSGYALKRYKRYVDYWAGGRIIKRYEPFFDWRWKELSYKYIDSLTDFKYRGYWYRDVLDRGKLYYFIVRLWNKILQKTIWASNRRKKIENNINELPREYTLCSRPSEQEFLTKTKEYINELLSVPNKDKKPFVVVDQIVPPSNVDRYLRYFDDICVFIVDRDPRDIYYLAKYVWKIRIIPTENPDLFCKWYKYTREHRKVETFNKEKVMFVQFEDMILKYDKTMANIRDFAGVNEKDHMNIFGGLDPKVSINNVMVWKKTNDKKRLEEISFIEKELREYLYQFEI